MAFAHIEPFGFQADLYGHAMTSATIMNSKRVKRSQKIWEASDFMPEEESKKREKGSFIDALKSYFGLSKDKK